MRIISGSARGRRLLVPDGRDVRPTSDRVKGAIFNSLGSLGVGHPENVLDLFAGTGALGLEALSRGARSATLVESNRRHLQCLRQNVSACGFEDRASVEATTAEAFLKRDQRHWDLVLVDPPYDYDGWKTMLDQLSADIVVIESDRPIELPADWRYLKEKTYGTTVVGIAAAGTENRSPDLVENR